MTPTSDEGDRAWSFATRQIHAGRELPGGHAPRAVPLYLTAGFEFDDFDQAHGRFAGTDEGYSYTRVANPTTAALERRIAALEGGVDAVVVASGQAATASALLGLLRAGDHLVCAAGVYEGTRELIADNLAGMGVTASFVDDPADPRAWAAALTPQTRLLLGESISNPRGQVLDVAAVGQVAHAHGVPLVVDNTLATPYLLRPLEHGADVVVHSASKFLAGHGTVIAGVVVDGGTFPWREHALTYPQLARDRGADGRTAVERAGRAALADHLRSRVTMRFGPTPSPLSSFLVLQGIETLSVRMERHCATALTLARWLHAHPAVESVDHAGLPHHPEHERARRYLPDGQGSVLAVTLRGGRTAAAAFVDAVELFTRMTHLGDVRSLVLHPATTTHVLRSEAEQRAAGIEPGLLRLSIGLEDPDDLLADLTRGLAAATRAVAAEHPPAEVVA